MFLNLRAYAITIFVATFLYYLGLSIILSSDHWMRKNNDSGSIKSIKIEETIPDIPTKIELADIGIAEIDLANIKPAKIEQHDLIYGPRPRRNTVPIVNEEYNVIFFQVAKAASTEWKRFFSRLEGHPHWCAGHETNIHTPSVNKLKLLSDYTLEEAQTRMTNSTWKKVIFVRHPKPRVLSAFLDKAVKNTEEFLERYCPKYVRRGGNFEDCVNNHQDFGFFLKNFTSTTFVRDDMHWRSIYSRIDEKWWPHINFVGDMDNLNVDAKRLLLSVRSNRDSVSAWDRIGQSGWGDKESDDCSKAVESQGSFLGVGDPSHETKAKSQMMEYYTPELEALVEERYSDDLNNPYFHFKDLKLFPGSKAQTKSKKQVDITDLE